MNIVVYDNISRPILMIYVEIVILERPEIAQTTLKRKNSEVGSLT